MHITTTSTESSKNKHITNKNPNHSQICENGSNRNGIREFRKNKYAKSMGGVTMTCPNREEVGIVSHIYIYVYIAPILFAKENKETENSRIEDPA